jgi:hypothetical protein
MNRIRTKTWSATLLTALFLACGDARGGEVTVIGSPWFGRPAPGVTDSRLWQQAPLAPDGMVVQRTPGIGTGSLVQGKPSVGGSNAVVAAHAEVGVEPWAREGAFQPQDASALSGIDAGSAANGAELLHEELPCRMWTIDYRFRSVCAANTAYEFGTPEPPPTGWSPLSRLDFPLNSLWHGLRVGVEQPNWCVQFEWMMPQQGIQGDLSDYDWNPANSNGSYSDLGFAQERWSGAWGQMMDFGGEFLLAECSLGLPVEVWPIAGFRWQRFEMTAFDLVQVKYDNAWHDPPMTYSGDVLTFNQQYYIGYLGSQFRTRLGAAAITFQADWGYTWGNNVDHHLIREGNRYTMDSTQGNSWHIAVMTEVPLNEQVSLGFQYDHLAITTRGSHHQLNFPRGEDATWDNGVSVTSNQNWITGFVRLRF